jgi:Na+/proline symporter
VNGEPGRSEAVLWWLGKIVLTLCGCFFVLFGIYVLVASFSLADPALFILSFIASTMIILFSGAIVAGLVAQMIRTLRSGNDKQNKE